MGCVTVGRCEVNEKTIATEAFHRKHLIVQNLSDADCGKPQPNRRCPCVPNALGTFVQSQPQTKMD